MGRLTTREVQPQHEVVSFCGGFEPETEAMSASKGYLTKRGTLQKPRSPHWVHEGGQQMMASMVVPSTLEDVQKTLGSISIRP